jgi:peptidoglycan/xylan/chitin deacetylase (PgdA/CDA1 family)
MMYHPSEIRIHSTLIASRKQLLARLFETTGLNGALLRIQARLWRPHVRVLNYHDVPPHLAPAFEEQLRLFAEHFDPVGRSELLALQRREWRPARPGLVLSFDDGLRSHAETVAPLLDKYGFTGWFLLPVGFLETPVAEQSAYAREHRISAGHPYADGRLAMTWEQARALEVRHVLACHTMHHSRLPARLTSAELDVEIDGAKRLMEQRLGHEVEAFGWVGGEEWGYSREAAERIRAAGFRIGFMTNNALFRPGGDLLQIQRTNVEAHFPLEVARFQMTGFLDLLYLPKRKRVNRLTAVRA